MGRLEYIKSHFIHYYGCVIFIIMIIATRFFAFAIMYLCNFLLFASFKLDTSP